MDENIINIPFVAHEAAMNRMERANKRMQIIAICELLVIILMFSGIMLYFYMPNEVSETTEQNVADVDNSEINQSIGD